MVLDPQRVLADQVGAERVDHLTDGRWVRPAGGLAQADLTAMRQHEARQSIEELADADVSFHQHLIELGDNGVANRAWAAIADFTRTLLSVSDTLVSLDQLVANAHEDIVAGLAAGDTAAAERAIAAHYRHSTEAMTAAGLLRG